MPKKKTLNVAQGFALPADIITQKTGIVARSGAGKSTTACAIVEELLDLRQQVVILDPKGDWWGIRSSADGKGDGYAVSVMGGLHGDIALEPTAGEVVADFVVDTGASVVLDVSEFFEGEKERFVADFAYRFYRRKASQKTPVLFVLEEADEFVPQMIDRKVPHQTKMIGAAQQIAKRGRYRGIGLLLVTQRPADLNKKVLSQIEVLIAQQMTHELDVKAVDGWLKHQPDQEKRKEVLGNLQSLQVGEAFVYSPSWLKVFKRVQFRQRKTFDAGRTPEVGEAHREPERLAKIDLDALRDKMAETLEKVKENDPEELKKQIRELKAQLRKAETIKPEPEVRVEVERVEVPVVDVGHLKVLAKLREQLARIPEILRDADDILATQEIALKAKQDEEPKVTKTVRPVAPAQQRPAAAPQPRPSTPPSENGIAPRTQKILDGLAELEALGVATIDRVQAAFFAGYSHTRSKGFTNALSEARTQGFVDYPDAGTVALTPEGRQLASAAAAPTSVEEAQERILRLVGGKKAEILRALIAAYPDAMTRDALAAAVGYGHVRSKGFTNSLSRLSSLGLVTYPSSGDAAAAPVLFLEAST